MAKKNKEKYKQRQPLVNKKARFNFELQSTIEAGIMLTGSEVKSLRDNKGNLNDAYAVIKRGEVFLHNFNISPYTDGGYSNHPEIRPRKLLLHKKEIEKLERQIKEKGLALVAVKCYFKSNKFVKVELALAKPKKLYDKRETMKKQDAKKEMDREMKNRIQS